MQIPTVTVSLGSEPGASRPEPVSVRVDRHVDVPADAATVLLPPGPPPALGDRMEVALGVDGAAEPVFTGIVAQARNQLDRLVVSAVGGLLPLIRLRAPAPYPDRPAAAVVTDLASRAGMPIGILADTPVLPAFAVDSRSSAEAQVRRLAGRLG